MHRDSPLQLVFAICFRLGLVCVCALLIQITVKTLLCCVAYSSRFNGFVMVPNSPDNISQHMSMKSHRDYYSLVSIKSISKRSAEKS